MAVVAIAAIGALGWYLQRGRQPEPVAVPVAPPPVVEQPAQAPEPAEKPAAPVDTTPLIAAPLGLDNSDGQVRVALSDFAPKLAQWLTPEEQVRKWVALIDQLADGKWPVRHRPVDFPLPGFKVLHKGDQLKPDPSNYKRTDALVQAFTEIPVERMAQYYHAWLPVLDKAYAELGGTGTFDKRLRLAIRRVLATRPLPPDLDLVRPVIVYKYADEQLELASEVEKMTWRLGPQNTKRLQEYLRRFEQLM